MTKDQIALIDKTIQFVNKHHGHDCSGHDAFHVKRVFKLACHIAKKEHADLFVVSLASLLHDVDDWKLADDSTENQTKAWLISQGVELPVIEKILRVIEQVSFRGAGTPITETLSLEAKIVQDADRLDALGAIGIARTFAYGGFRHRTLYDPGMRPAEHNSFESYKNNNGSTINHFYEKLLLLKDRINTGTAKEIAERRHQVMQNFLEDFFDQWNLKDVHK